MSITLLHFSLIKLLVTKQKTKETATKREKTTRKKQKELLSRVKDSNYVHFNKMQEIIWRRGMEEFP